MNRIQPPLSSSLQFAVVGSENERMVDVSATIRRGALVTRRKHSSRGVTVPALPYELVYYPLNGRVHSLAADGKHYADNILADSGYHANRGSFLIITPRSTSTEQYVFIASNKMSKFREGIGTQKWGIDAPSSTMLVPITGFLAETVVDNCDSTANWTTVGATIATEGTIKTEGANSLKFGLTANTQGVATKNLGVAMDYETLNFEGVFYFSLRFENPAAIQSVLVQFSLANNDFTTAVAHFTLALPGTAGGSLVEIPGAANEWKTIGITQNRFGLTASGWTTTWRMRFVFLSSATQNVYVDYIHLREPGQNDSVGARYKYRYENSITGHSSNLNDTPSARFIGSNTEVEVLNPVTSTDPQVDRQAFYRDVGGDGNFRRIGTKANDGTSFFDTTPISGLGEADTNDNAPPVAATIATFFAGSVWINDVVHPFRIWRSVAGRYESFSEFFDLPISDIVHCIGIVGGQLCVVTTNNIYRVVGADTVTPRFIPFIDIGIPSQRAITITNDVAYLVNFTGGYVFNGSTIKMDDIISRLFIPSSSDPKRINETIVDRCILGSDDKHIWLTYNMLNGVPRTLVRDLDTGEWTEETEIIVAHDKAHLTYPHIMARQDNVLMNSYSGVFAAFDYRSLDLSLTTVKSQDISMEEKRLSNRSLGISQIINFGIELRNEVTMIVMPFVDDVGLTPLVISTSTARRWEFIAYTGGERVIGERLAFSAVAAADGFVEIYAVEWWLVEMQAAVKALDSGDVFLSSELVIPLELNIALYAHEPLTFNATWFTDNLPQTVATGVPANGLYNHRWFLRPDVGRTGRLIIAATGRFSPIANVASVITLGTGEIKPVEIRATAT